MNHFGENLINTVIFYRIRLNGAWLGRLIYLIANEAGAFFPGRCRGIQKSL